MSPPSQIGELLPAVAVGVAFTVTSVVEVAVHPFTSVMVTLYVPLSVGVAAVTVGFCRAEVNVPGPSQLQLVASPAVSVRLMSPPSQIGELLPAVAVGVAFTVTSVVEVAVHPFTSVMVTLYVPLSVGVAAVIVGFC